MQSTVHLKTFHPLVHTNPWVGIWRMPRRTLRIILDENPAYWVWPLAALGGMSPVMEQAMVSSLGQYLDFGAVMLMILLGGGLLGIGMLYFFSTLLAWTGRLLHGRGTRRELRAAMAWANLPLGVEFTAFIILLPGLWATAFTGHPPHTNTELLSLGIIGLTRIIGGAWSLALLVLGVAEAQRFGFWRAIVNLLLVVALYLVLGFAFFPALLAVAVMLTGYPGMV